MKNLSEKICLEGLGFFSRSNRLISHELKNVLAIISETLGLLYELVEMSVEEGMELKPEKLKSLTQSVLEEIERANRVVNDMNISAHTMDNLFAKTGIGDILYLITELSQWKSSTKKLDIDVETPEDLVVYTSPFYLLVLLYKVFLFCSGHISGEYSLTIKAASGNDRVTVSFEGIIPGAWDKEPDEKVLLVAEMVSARIKQDDSGNLLVQIPETLEDT